MDARLEALLDKQSIEEVVLRYCRGIDRGDLDLVRSCYHPDAVDHHGSFSGDVEAYLEWLAGLLARYRMTMHLVGNVLIEFEETPGAPPDIAACETYGVSIHRSDDPKPYLNLATGFRYLDRFERREGKWKIAERTALGEWSLRLPEDAWWEIPEAHASGKRDGGDVLYTLLASLDPSAGAADPDR